MAFQFETLAIPDIFLITPEVRQDNRGFFVEVFKRSAFAAEDLAYEFVQENLSYSHRGVIRGLHYQAEPAAQVKLISVIRGRVFDVAVDLRKGSPTFAQWVGVTLSDRLPQALYIPRGFAHGFCVLSPEAFLSYRVSSEHQPDQERGLRWDDPAFTISWPVEEPVLSQKDRRWPPFDDLDTGFVYDVAPSKLL